MFYLKIKNKKQKGIFLIAIFSLLITNASCNKTNDVDEINSLIENENKNDSNNLIDTDLQTTIKKNKENTAKPIEDQIYLDGRKNKKTSKNLNKDNLTKKIINHTHNLKIKNKQQKIDPKIYIINPKTLEFFKNTNREGLISGEWLEKTDKYEAIRKLLPKAYEIHKITQTKNNYLDSNFSAEQNKIDDIINQLEIEEQKNENKKNNSKKLNLLKKLETILTIRKRKSIFSSETELRYVGDQGIAYENAKEAYSELRRVIEKLEENGVTDTPFNGKYELSLKKIRDYREEFRTLQNLIGGRIPEKAEDLYDIRDVNPDSLIGLLKRNKINIDNDDLKNLYSLQEITKQMKNLDKGKIKNIDNYIDSLNEESYESIKNLVNKVNIPRKSKWQDSTKFMQLLKLVYLYSLPMRSYNEIKPSGESLKLDIYNAIREQVEDEESDEN